MILFIFVVSILFPLPSLAAIKYVTKSGTCSDGATTYSPSTDTCGVGSSTVYTSIRSGGANIGASNTLQIRGGTYTESCITAQIIGGTSGNPTRIEPYSGEAVVWIKGTADTRDCLISFAGAQPWIVLDGKNSDGTGSMILDGQSRNVSADQAILTGNNVTNVTIRNIELRNSAESCIVSVSNGSVVENNDIHDCGTSNSYLWHGIYYAGVGVIVRNNTFRNIAGYGVHCYSGGSDCTSSQILNNKLYNIGTASDAQSGGILSDGPDNIIRYNVVRCTGTSTDFGIHLYQNATRNLVDHNSVTNCGTGINLASTTSNHSVRNNIFFSNGANTNNSSSGSTFTTNQTTNPSWTNATTADLTLTSGSTAINTCTNIGLSFNGLAPDCGAFETFTGTGGSVTGNTLNAQLGMSFRVPVNAGSTGWSVNNGRTVTGVTVISSSIVQLTFSGSSCLSSESWSWSYSGGTATDNASIGSTVFGVLNQPLFTVSSVSVTNGCTGSVPTYSFSQQDYQFRGIFYNPDETHPDIRSLEDVVTYKVVANGATLVRFSLKCDPGVDCPSTAFSLKYNITGTYIYVPNTLGADNISFCGDRYTGRGVLVNPTPTTNQLSTSGSFVPGAVIYTSDAIPDLNLAAGQKTEMEACLYFNSSASGNYLLKWVTQDGTDLTNYIHTPIIVVVPNEANGMP